MSNLSEVRQILPQLGREVRALKITNDNKAAEIKNVRRKWNDEIQKRMDLEEKIKRMAREIDDLKKENEEIHSLNLAVSTA